MKQKRLGKELSFQKNEIEWIKTVIKIYCMRVVYIILMGLALQKLFGKKHILKTDRLASIRDWENAKGKVFSKTDFIKSFDWFLDIPAEVF